MLELADVVIVGGGIMGLALAHELARRPVRVALLEAAELGSEATGSSFCWLNATSKTEDEAYHRINVAGMAAYRLLAEQWGAAALGLRFGGSLAWLTGEDAAAEAALDRKYRRLQELGYPAAILKAAEMRALEPAIRFEEGKVSRGLFTPSDMWIDHTALVGFLAERARAHGADINPRCPALEFTCDAAGHISTVRTPRGRIATRNVVIAAGVETAKLAASVQATERILPLLRLPGLLARTPPLPELEGICRVLYPPDAGGLHLRPEPGGGVLLGADDTDEALRKAMGPGGGEARHGAGALDAMISGLTASLAERLARFVPGAAPGLAGHCTARIGVRPVPGDGLPIVGPMPGVAGLFVAVTHSGYTLAPALAGMLADEIVTGRTHAPIAPYRPSRFLA